MIQGSSSSVGKSVLVAALCRIFARRGIRVAPFKAQNMSNNAAVCPDGCEIGRSQAVQAAAARVAPTAWMNPILLKPEADSRSQVIVAGRPWRTLEARAYCRQREELWPVVTDALDRLRREYDLVIIEGAGSPAELNLCGCDLVNMPVAQFCDAPVLLVGDIDRGGVFAQLLGTLSLLDDDDRQLVRGLIVNKFRGDLSLFDSGREILQERAGIPVLGIVPWMPSLHLPEEDGQPLESAWRRQVAAELDLAVIQLPRIANFDDFDAVAAESGVCVRFVRSLDQLGEPSAIILPGTKSTVSDLKWLQESGLAERIVHLGRQGTAVVGICGGYQMLGQSIVDPDHVESSCSEITGLGLLPHKTAFAHAKVTHVVQAKVRDDRHCPGCRGEMVSGYEIHMGHTSSDCGWLELTERSGNRVSCTDGTVSEDGRIWGCYLHGLFENDRFRRNWLHSLRVTGTSIHPAETGEVGRESCISAAQKLDARLDDLANHVQAALDMDRLDEIILAGQGEKICLKT
jgi:adenosylcobyric acid synthase